MYDDEYYEYLQRRYCLRYLHILESIALNNKYTRWYINIVDSIIHQNLTRKEAKNIHGYIESHHIIPRCISRCEYDIKSKYNIVHCTAKQHFLLHILLVKMFDDIKIVNKFKKAVSMFCKSSNTQNRVLNSYQYAYARKCASESNSGCFNSGFGKPAAIAGRKCYNNGIANKFIKDGDKIPEGYRLGSSRKGVISITNGFTNKSIERGEIIPEGYWKGSYTKGRVSRLKGRKVGKYSEERKRAAHKPNIGNRHITNGISDKKLRVGQEIPEGWYIGRSNGSAAKENNPFSKANFKQEWREKSIINRKLSRILT